MKTVSYQLKDYPEPIAKLIRDRGGLVTMQTRGGSMYPALRDGDEIGVEFVSPDSLKIGDILLVRLSGNPEPVAHRLVRITEKRFITKGDACLGKENDPPLTVEQILGRVVRRKRAGKIKNLRTRHAILLGRIIALVTRDHAWLLKTLKALKTLFSKMFYKNKLQQN